MEEKYSIADKLAIRELVEKYTYIINHRHWEKLPSIFAENANWKALEPINLEFDGLDAIKTRIPTNVEKLAFLFQSSSEILITFKTENRAMVHSQLTEEGRFLEGGNGMKAIGSYEDIVYKENGIWRFLTRTFVLRYIDNDYPFRGDILK